MPVGEVMDEYLFSTAVTYRFIKNELSHLPLILVREELEVL